MRPSEARISSSARRNPPRRGPGRNLVRLVFCALPGDESRSIGKVERKKLMKANCWMANKKVEVRDVPEPKILNQRDAIVKITSTAICGSDLHLYNGFVPSMEKGDVLGHEFMGEVVEVGSAVKNLKSGDRVVVPFPISCGNCWFCQEQLFSCCENSNPNALLAEKMFGHAPA